MATRSNSSGNLTIMRIVLTVLGILVFTAVCRPSLADELPAFRQGMWKFERTVGKEKFEVTKCTSPSEDMRKQNAMLEKGGCRFSPVKKSGNVYTFTADCSIKTPSGAAISSRTTSVMTVESDTAYKIEIDGVTDGQTTKELLVAQRIGDCNK